VSLPARDLQALLRHAAANSPSDAAKLLLDWNCALTTDSAAATLYVFWAAELEDALTKLVVPAEAAKAGGRRYLTQVVEDLSHPNPQLFGSQPESARNKLLLQTLQEAETKLTAKLGIDRRNWEWGKLHEVVFNHPLDVTDALAKLFDLGPVERPGDGNTVNATAFAGKSYYQLAGASYREVFDLSDWDKGVGVNVPGQSGQPESKHYGDLLPLWAHGQYFPLSFSKQAVDRETTDVLELKP
jgi:penicillin amidase